MKKLLAIFGAIGLTATTASAVVACKDPASKTEKKSIDDIDLGTVTAEIGTTSTGKISEADAKRIKDTIFTDLQNKMKLSDNLKDITIKQSDYSIVNGDKIKAEALITDIQNADYQIKASDSSTVIKGTSKKFKIKLEQKTNPTIPDKIEFDLGEKTIESTIEFHYEAIGKTLTKDQHVDAVYNEVLKLSDQKVLNLIKAQYAGKEDLINADNLQRGVVYKEGTNNTKVPAEKADFEKDQQELFVQFIGKNKAKGYFYIKIKVNHKTRFLGQAIDTITIASQPKALEALIVDGDLAATKTNVEKVVRDNWDNVVATIAANTSLYRGKADNITSENLLLSGVKGPDKKVEFKVGDINDNAAVYVEITGAAAKPVEGTVLIKVTLKKVLSA